MKRFLSLLLSAVMAASAAMASFAAPPVNGNSAITYITDVDFEDVTFDDGKNSMELAPYKTVKFGEAFRTVPKQFVTEIREESGNKFFRISHIGYDPAKDTSAKKSDKDSYFDVAFKEGPIFSNHPYFAKSFVLSYDIRFEQFEAVGNCMAQWDLALFRIVKSPEYKSNSKVSGFRIKRDVGNKNSVILIKNATNGNPLSVLKEIDLNQWYNVALVYDLDKKDISLYLNGEYLSSIHTDYEWSNQDKPTWISCGWAIQGDGSYKGIADVDNVKFYNLPDGQLTPENVLNADVIESIADAVKINCPAYHAQPADAAATSKLLSGTYTFETTSPTTALVTLNPANYADYYKLLGSDHAKKGSGDARTTISLEYKDGAWALAGDPAQLYVTCDAKAPVDYTVTYVDGCDGYAFAAQPHTVTKEYNQPDPATPLFMGTPQRNGYQFLGWSPMVEKTVTHDVVYTAIWKEIVVFRPALGSATLTVTDTDGKPLAGAKFELHRVASNGTDTVVDTFTTDRNGAIKLYANPKANTGLSPNSGYYWKQIEAPNGYKIAEENLSFAARYGSTAKLTLVNEKN